MITFRQLRPGRCKYPVAPYGRTHVFCGKCVKPGKPYCEAHCDVCYDGIGKPWEGLAGMIDATEQTVIVRRRVPADVQKGLDEELEGA